MRAVKVAGVAVLRPRLQRSHPAAAPRPLSSPAPAMCWLSPRRFDPVRCRPRSAAEGWRHAPLSNAAGGSTRGSRPWRDQAPIDDARQHLVAGLGVVLNRISQRAHEHDVEQDQKNERRRQRADQPIRYRNNGAGVRRRGGHCRWREEPAARRGGCRASGGCWCSCDCGMKFGEGVAERHTAGCHYGYGMIFQFGVTDLEWGPVPSGDDRGGGRGPAPRPLVVALPPRARRSLRCHVS